MQLFVHNNYSHFNRKTVTKELIEAIHEVTTITVKYYAQKQWKVKQIRYFNEKSGEVPTGLLPRIIPHLKANDFDIEILDKRQNESSFVDVFLTLPKPTTSDADYSFQEQAVEDAIAAERGLLHYPTGAGKTVIIARIIDRLKQKSLIIVPNLTLLNQTTEKFYQYFGEKQVSKLGESEHLNPGAPITIATHQTLWGMIKTKRLDFERLIDGVNALFIDECHHVSVGSPWRWNRERKEWVHQDNINNTWWQVAMEIPAYYRFGVSATLNTPDSPNNQFVLESTTGRVISKISMTELIERKVLCGVDVTMYYMKHPRYTQWATKYKKDGTVEIAGAHENNIVYNSTRNKLLADLALKAHAKGRQVLVLVDRIETQGKDLHRMLPNSVFLVGKSTKKERAEGLDLVKTNRNILIGSIFKEGFDLPAIDTLIVASGGKSHVKMLQQIGRAVRVSPGKDRAEIFDVYDDDNSFCMRHSDERKTVYTSEKLYTLKIENLAPKQKAKQKQYSKEQAIHAI